jgi:hypothetical protein
MRGFMPSSLVKGRESVELKTLIPKLNNLKILYQNYSSFLSLRLTVYTQII